MGSQKASKQEQEDQEQENQGGVTLEQLEDRIVQKVTAANRIDMKGLESLLASSEDRVVAKVAAQVAAAQPADHEQEIAAAYKRGKAESHPVSPATILTANEYAEHRVALRARFLSDLQRRLSPLLVQAIAYELEAQEAEANVKPA